MSLFAPFSPLLAQAAPGGGLAQYSGLIFNVALIFAIWYFLVIRPQQKQRRTHEAALLNLRKGDEIVTTGGIVGEVIHIKETLKDGQSAKTLDDRVTIKSSDSKLVVERGRIAKVVKSSASDG
ncbi:MAG TPA: preprotein translocase subunit YajC [Gemmatimonadaceae bacterium]|nr:preprotein translocase subunit YajC [Gemmatimonadaceae bacterium]